MGRGAPSRFARGLGGGLGRRVPGAAAEPEVGSATSLWVVNFFNRVARRARAEAALLASIPLLPRACFAASPRHAAHVAGELRARRALCPGAKLYAVQTLSKRAKGGVRGAVPTLGRVLFDPPFVDFVLFSLSRYRALEPYPCQC